MKFRVKQAPPCKTNPSSKVVVGIDASLTGFGLCIFGVDETSGEMWNRLTRYASKKKGIERLIDIRNWFSMRLSEAGLISYVAMEGYAWGSDYNREVMGELGGVIKVALFEHLAAQEEGVVPCVLVPPQSLKKFTTGKGGAKKEQMLLAVFKKWKVDAHSNDEADAYSLARVAAAIVGLTEPTFDYEREVIDKLTGRGPVARTGRHRR